MSWNISLLIKQKLLISVSLFGIINIKLWILIALGVSFTAFASITILCLCCILRRTKKPSYYSYKPDNHPVRNNIERIIRSSESTKENNNNKKSTEHVLRIGGSHRIDVEPRASFDGWRRSFSSLEIEKATNELSRDNVIGHGDCGTVYHGVLLDGTKVAVKKLLVNSCEAEEFVAQMEEVGHVRHKNLVKLLGYSIEGFQRMLVYEYVENKSLHYWLHQCPDQLSPLSWQTRMDIIYGIAKGLEYLHDGIEQRIIHRALKSSNVMLDNQWNPKLTDFGVAKLFSPQWGYILMEALGYVAPEKDHNSAYNLTEKHDVYSFGVLTLEIITGRAPIDRSRSQAYVIEWVKSMVASGNMGIVADPKLGETPSVKDLKRILLIALRCIDSNEENRPSVRDLTLMFLPRDLLLNDDDLYFLC